MRAAALRSVRVRALDFSAAAVGVPSGISGSPARRAALGLEVPPPRWSRRDEAAVEETARRKEAKGGERWRKEAKRGERRRKE